MNQPDFSIKQKTNIALEGIEYAIVHENKQVNKNLPALLKKIVVEITKHDYEKFDDLKRLVYGVGRPEASGPDNDIFSMVVHAGSKARTLDEFLTDLIEEGKNSVGLSEQDF